jgi:copper oxidase (laccase) domain-containing protein
MLHAGWRGLAAGVIERGVEAVRELGDGAHSGEGDGDGAAELTAAIGPAAGPCCYEVGDEVRAAFTEYGDVVRRGARNLDLKAIARIQLERAGIAIVHDADICTICADASLFFSHRRDGGRTGRQAGVAWLT